MGSSYLTLSCEWGGVIAVVYDVKEMVEKLAI
jgi:hypothetical protein